jgi:HAE1 family hydrophobic/amphiphilic exporter-1
VLFDLLGVSLNLISLSGLSLGVGMLVDNSILVMENIARLREQGLDAATAARRGTADVFGAVNAGTVTTLAVFLPLSFSEGLAGRLFRDQSIAVCCSVGASLVVAVTAVPLLAARDRTAGGAERTGHALGAAFERALAGCLARPAAVLGATALALLAGLWVALVLPRASLPQAEQGRVEAAASLPTDADLPLVDERLLPVERAARSWPGVAHVLADLGEHDDARLDLDPRPIYRADLTLVLAPGHPAAPTVSRLRAAPLPGDVKLAARAVRPQLESLLAQGDADLVVDLSSARREAAEQVVDRLLAGLKGRPELAQVVRADPERVPAYRIDLDRDAMTRLAARPEMIETYLEASSLGREATRLAAIDEEIPVVLRAPPAETIEGLLAARVPVAGALLPLGTFLRARPAEIPAVLLRRDQVPTLRLLAAIAPRATLQSAVAAVRGTASEVLPKGVELRLGGASEAFRSALSALGLSLALSTLLVYLILAAQFESLWQPLLVLTTLPAAGAGVAVALALAGQTWNLMSLTACVILVGIAVNHAIVEVEVLNQRFRAGLPLEEALRAAGRDRFRPIAMTTLTTVLGLLPLALGIGEGAKLQKPLAVAIIGGLTSSTLVALFVVPILYRWTPGSRTAHAPRPEEAREP